MKKKANRINIAAMLLLVSIVVTSCSYSKNSTDMGETEHTPKLVSKETHEQTILKLDESPEEPVLLPVETPETTIEYEMTEVPIISSSNMPQTLEDISVLSGNTVRFAGLEGDFSTLEYYYMNLLYYDSDWIQFGNYNVMLINGSISTLSFTEKILSIDNLEIQLGPYNYEQIALFLIDLDVTDRYREVLICEYGDNDFLANTIYLFDGSAITEVARFTGQAFFDSNGKMVPTDSAGGNLHGRIADPIITRSYYELHYGRLEEINIPIKDITFTFSDYDDYFNFYEISDAPTPEIVDRLLESSTLSDDSYCVRDLAGQSFTICEYSEQKTWFRGAWYYVKLEDGRKGIIYWWYAG